MVDEDEEEINTKLMKEDEYQNNKEESAEEDFKEEESLLMERKGSTLNQNIDNDATERTIFYVLVTTTEAMAAMCIILVSIWTVKYLDGFSWSGPTQFNYHPLFMVIGMVVLFGNSAISYRVLRYQEKYSVKLIHACLHFGAFVCAVIGLIAVFGFHNKKNYPNMYSLHSWVGITTVVLYAFQLLFGFICFLFPTIKSEHRRIYLTVHVFFGCVIFALAIVSCISGITEKMLFDYMATYSKFPAVGIVANLLGVSLVLFGLLVSIILYNPSYKVVFWKKAF